MSDTKAWDAYYARTQELPVSDNIAHFLTRIPQNGRILDVGTGTGRWVAAFLRDRPDLTIDIIDRSLEKATLIPDEWSGEKIQADFVNFKPSRPYDGVWMFDALFFLEKESQDVFLNKMCGCLKKDGVLYLSMVGVDHDPCDGKRDMFYGRPEADLKTVLQECGLEIISTELKEKRPYRREPVMLPTYFILARKVF